MNLVGRTALITGSVQGIGLAVATALAEAGARIAVHGIATDEQQKDACRQLDMCHLQLRTFAAQNCKILAPVELEGISRVKM